MPTGSDPVLLDRTAAKLVEEMKGLPTVVAPRVNADLRRSLFAYLSLSGDCIEVGVTSAVLNQTHPHCNTGRDRP
ncbi:MAG: hypothetical protein U5J78_03065 [Parasphingorhabdus sp.]|nr:hypothetical protein [Parasphingorhabdus sp.]